MEGIFILRWAKNVDGRRGSRKSSKKILEKWRMIGGRGDVTSYVVADRVTAPEELAPPGNFSGSEPVTYSTILRR